MLPIIRSGAAGDPADGRRILEGCRRRGTLTDCAAAAAGAARWPERVFWGGEAGKQPVDAPSVYVHTIIIIAASRLPRLVVR